MYNHAQLQVRSYVDITISLVTASVQMENRVNRVKLSSIKVTI